MKFTIFLSLTVLFIFGCSNKDTSEEVGLFKEPHSRTFVIVTMNHPEGNSVSKSINTLEGMREADLSGEGTRWKRNASFMIEDVSNDGFDLKYNIFIDDGSSEIYAEAEKEIRFNQPKYTIDLEKGFTVSVELKESK